MDVTVRCSLARLPVPAHSDLLRGAATAISGKEVGGRCLEPSSEAPAGCGRDTWGRVWPKHRSDAPSTLLKSREAFCSRPCSAAEDSLCLYKLESLKHHILLFFLFFFSPLSYKVICVENVTAFCKLYLTQGSRRHRPIAVYPL